MDGAARWRHPDIAAGLVFAGAGVATLWFGRDYADGTLRRVGPGALPDLLALLLLGLGGVIALRGVGRAVEPSPPPAWRAVALVLAGIAAFALLIDHAGLMIAGVVAMAVARAAAPPLDWRETAIAAVLVTGFAVLLFVVGLKLPMTVWPR